MRWNHGASWRWYRAPVETQALMIEAFDEVTGDGEAVRQCKQWLLGQKRTGHCHAAVHVRAGV